MKDLCALVLVTASLCAVGVASTMPAIVVTAAARSIRPGELVVLTITPGAEGPIGRRARLQSSHSRVPGHDHEMAGPRRHRSDDDAQNLRR